MSAEGLRQPAALPELQAASSASPLHFKVEAENGMPAFTTLVFALVLVAGAVFLVKRYGGGRLLQAKQRSQLVVCEAVWVAPKLRVSRLQYEGRTMLLASSPQGLAWLDLGLTVSTDVESSALPTSEASHD